MLYTPLPVFKGYNYDNNEYDVLCISDILLKKYNHKKLLLSWFLSTKNNNYFNKYIGLFEKIFHDNKYAKIVFCGSSGGGYPSLIFSSYFANKYNCIALIQNCQIYLDKHNYFEKMINIIPDIDYRDVENFIKTHTPPNILYIQNINDLHHYNNHFLPFCEFYENLYGEKCIKKIPFVGREPINNKTHHHINLPKGLSR